MKTLHNIQQEQLEKAIAVCVINKNNRKLSTDDSLNELIFLAKTANVEVVEIFTQSLPSKISGTYIGSGKIEEIKNFCIENDISTVIFDDELTPTQTRNLELNLERKVIDRTSLILDIFSTRAKTKEAITQVQLAQFQYLLPRLTNMWTHLSKQYGGVGTKGPGETQIETDRRLIKTKISHLKQKLLEIETERYEQRKNRSSLFRVALVGYTNAGKSTLMNLLSNSNVFVENLLFATLDTTVRKVELNSNVSIIFSDTVGFIRKLPTNLIASFKSTLAEVLEADLLLHVVDLNHKNFLEHISVVEETLEELNAKKIPQIFLFNKIDLIEDKNYLKEIAVKFKNSIFISAQIGFGIETLKNEIIKIYKGNWQELDLLFSHNENNIISKLYEVAEIISKRYDEEKINVKIKIQKNNLEKIKPWILKNIVTN